MSGSTILRAVGLLSMASALCAEPSRATAILTRCTGCHNASAKSGGLDLNALISRGGPSTNPETWWKVFEKIENSEMPPKAAGPMPTVDRALLVAHLEGEFGRLRESTSANRVTVRRLNRSEYNNTVRDLLGIDFQPARDFPADDSGYGFDNIGEVLSMSPSLLEKYLSAAEKASRLALFGAPSIKPAVISLQPWYIDFSTSREVLKDYDETGMSLPSALHAKYRFPVTADYEIAGLLRGTRPNGSEDIPVRFWIDGKPVKELFYPVPPGGEVSGQRRQFRIHIPAGEHWLSASVLRIYEGLPPSYHGPNPSKKPPPPVRRGVASNNDEAPPQGRQGGGLPRQATTAFFVSNLDITGPFDPVAGPPPESLSKIYTCGHKDGKHNAGCERKILTSLARRAYRRPPTTGELSALSGFARLARDQGDSFEEGLALAIQKILISPDFLFRLEPGQAISASALQTRLSYFLWSSMPDEVLAADKLVTPASLSAQVRRMLRDQKSQALVENFGGQWLQFRGLESHEPDRKKFQEFTEYTRMSMVEETSRLFSHIIREDRSILELITAKYSFLNERLANYYGVPGVKGHEFRKVELGASPRAGVLGHGSVLTVSSYANRTSPVLRGKWILDNLLNAPPPPAPPDIPNLDEAAVGAAGTLRQQMEAHRSTAACASCHVRMDPLGFSLENYDAIGRWREKDGKFPIDASGLLPDGRRFNGLAELAKVLEGDAPAFASAMTERLYTYALGRGLTWRDRWEVRRIAAKLPESGYRVGALVEAIVLSDAFRKKETPK